MQKARAPARENRLAVDCAVLLDRIIDTSRLEVQS
jgi:hypothetical protein